MWHLHVDWSYLTVQQLDSKNESSKRQDVESVSIGSFEPGDWHNVTLVKFCLLRSQRATTIRGEVREGTQTLPLERKSDNVIM